MANSRWPSNPEDQNPQYPTPKTKTYDYKVAVQGTAPLPSGNAGDSEDETDYSSQFVKPQKNMSRGKGNRDNITRGKPARRRAAGVSDATRKVTAKIRGSGRENNVVRGLNDPDPNLDPNLTYAGGQEYQRGFNYDFHYGAAPKDSDDYGSQGNCSDEPEDIDAGNKWLNNPNRDNDGSRGDSPIENDKEDDNEKDRTRFKNDHDSLEEEEKPYEGPMMTKKEILKRRVRNTQGYDDSLKYRKVPEEGWVPAVYHDSIRLDLINKARLNGEYDHARGAGNAPEDITSYLESQRTWGLERDSYSGGSYHRGNWPEILYQLHKPRNYAKSSYPKAEDWLYHGRIVISVHDDLPLSKIDTLPDTISSKITGTELEAILRSDPRVEARDIIGRMPMYYIRDDGQRVLAVTSSTISMRMKRFRADNALLCWTTRAGSDNTNDAIVEYLTEHFIWVIQSESLRGLGRPPEVLLKAIKESNKENSSVKNRAGLKFTLVDKSGAGAKTSAEKQAAKVPNVKGTSHAPDGATEQDNKEDNSGGATPEFGDFFVSPLAFDSSSLGLDSRSQASLDRLAAEISGPQPPPAEAPPRRMGDIWGSSDSEAGNPPLTPNRPNPRSVTRHNQPRPRAAPARNKRFRDNRSRSPSTTRQSIADRERRPPKQKPTTRQTRSAPPPPPHGNQPPKPTRGRPKKITDETALPTKQAETAFSTTRPRKAPSETAPPPARRYRLDSRSKSPDRIDERRGEREREPLEKYPTTRQTRPQPFAQPPEQQPSAASGPPSRKPRTKNLPSAVPVQPPEQPPQASEPPPRKHRTKFLPPAVPTKPPEQPTAGSIAPLRKALTKNIPPPAPPPEQQPAVASMPHQRNARTKYIPTPAPPLEQQQFAASFPLQRSARTKNIPPPTRRHRGENRSESPGRNDERRVERGRETPVEQNTSITRRTRLQASPTVRPS